MARSGAIIYLTSEKDGWMHLYKVSRDGTTMKLITNGDFDIVEINCIDPIGGFVYYIASPNNYTQRYLYRSKLMEAGNLRGFLPLIWPANTATKYPRTQSLQYIVLRMLQRPQESR